MLQLLSWFTFLVAGSLDDDDDEASWSHLSASSFNWSFKDCKEHFLPLWLYSDSSCFGHYNRFCLLTYLYSLM